MSKIPRHRITQIVKEDVCPTPCEAAALARVLDKPAELLRSYCKSCEVRKTLKKLLEEHGFFAETPIHRLLDTIKHLEAHYDAELDDLWKRLPPESDPAFTEYQELIKRTWGRKNDLNLAALMYFGRT